MRAFPIWPQTKAALYAFPKTCFVLHFPSCDDEGIYGVDELTTFAVGNVGPSAREYANAGFVGVSVTLMNEKWGVFFIFLNDDGLCSFEMVPLISSIAF